MLNFKTPILLVLALLFFCTSCEKKEDLNEYLVGDWYFTEMQNEDGTIETLEDMVWAEFFNYYHAPGIRLNSNYTIELYSIYNDSLTSISGPENTEWSINNSKNLHIYVGDTDFEGEFTINSLDEQTMTWHSVDATDNTWIKYQRNL